MGIHLHKSKNNNDKSGSGQNSKNQSTTRPDSINANENPESFKQSELQYKANNSLQSKKIQQFVEKANIQSSKKDTNEEKITDVTELSTFQENFENEFSDVKWLFYGGRSRTVKETASVVYSNLISVLENTKPFMDNVPNVENNSKYKTTTATSERHKTSESGETKKAIGPTKEFKEALLQAKHFANELKNLVKQSKKTKDKAVKGFAFWSGNPAKFAAKESDLTSLEGSQLGGIFENTKLPENIDMSIWGSISQAYAEWATEETTGKKYHGYIGLGGDRLNSIYNSVEKWAIQNATKDKADFSIKWFPVIPSEKAYLATEKIKNPYQSGPISSGGSDVAPGSGLTNRPDAEEQMREADSKRREDLGITNEDN